MKKLLVVLICFTLMFNLVLAGCGSKETDSSSKAETETKTDAQSTKELKLMEKKLLQE